MDFQLDMTLGDLFFVVGCATVWLPSAMREKVFQWLCIEMERRVPVEALRVVMRENGYMKNEFCIGCNNTITDWDFGEKGSKILCDECGSING